MTHYQLVTSNKTKSIFVIIGFIAFIMAAAYFMVEGFGYGLDLVGYALILAGLSSFGSYYFSDKIILTLSGAREATRKEFFDFYTVAENLSSSQKIPVPKLYVIDDTAMNAFATGRDPEHAVVCATTGLLSRMNRREVEAVVAHELSHVKNYDIRLMSLVTILVGFISLLADWILRMTYWGGRRKRDDRDGDQTQMILFAVGLSFVISINCSINKISHL
jgi:heat shock protein HtpX